MLKLRYYQEDAIKSFFDYTRENHGKHPIFVLPTGCVSWDTIINENRCKRGRKKEIESMYLAFNGLKKHKKHNYDKKHPQQFLACQTRRGQHYENSNQKNTLRV